MMLSARSGPRRVPLAEPSVTVAILLAVMAVHGLASRPAVAQGLSGDFGEVREAWYVGIGGGVGLLEPDADDGTDVDEGNPAAGTLFVGRDLDGRSSAQLQLYGLGEAGFDGGGSASYFGGDAAVLYRFVDSADYARSRGGIGIALYGRVGLGFMSRDSDLELEYDSPVWFGAGAGLELRFGPSFALRAEGLYHDRDAGSAFLSAMTRFGGSGRARGTPRAPIERDRPIPAPSSTPSPTPSPEPSSAPSSAPGPVPGPTPSVARPEPVPRIPAAEPFTDSSTDRDAMTASAPAIDPLDPVEPAVPTAPFLPDSPEVPELPDSPNGPSVPVIATDGDEDGDGVPDADDVCKASAAGYPVRDNGCALFDGVLGGVRFVDGGAELLPGSGEQLDQLAELLQEWPLSRVELRAHSDDAGTTRDQAILTRARLRTVGLYLVQRGILSNRLALRSFAGTRPLVDNDTPGNRQRNNRIEIFENTD